MNQERSRYRIQTALSGLAAAVCLLGSSPELSAQTAEPLAVESALGPPSTAALPPAVHTVSERVATFLKNQAELPCDLQATHAVGDRIWVACGAHGLLVLSDEQGELAARERRELGGSVQGFFTSGGSVWARISQEHAIALAESRPPLAGPPHRPFPGLVAAPTSEARSPAQVSEPAPAPKPEVPSGTVIRVDGRDVQISLGSKHGLQLHDNFALQDGDSLVVGGEEDRIRSRVVVASVVELWADRARLRIGVNEAVRVGMLARPTQDVPTKSRVSPPRVADVWEVRVMGRPMFSIGRLGGGLLAEASVGRRTALWHYGAALNPVGVGGDDQDGVTAPWAGYVFGAFDSKSFSAGLGLGAQTVHDTVVEKGSGLGIVQLLRLGSVDGLQLAARSSVVVFRSKTEFATLDMQGQLAVSEAAWLLFRGGGGSVGYGFGEVALRSLTRGNGGPGSFFLEVAVGGSVVVEASCRPLTTAVNQVEPCTDQVVAGPMLGLGGEWRF